MANIAADGTYASVKQESVFESSQKYFCFTDAHFASARHVRGNNQQQCF